MPLPDGLVVKKGLKTRRQSRHHAAPGMDHANRDIVAVFKDLVAGPQPRRRSLVGACDAELSAFGHRVTRVDRQVEQRAFEQVRIGRGEPRARVELEVEPDAFAERAMEQVFHACGKRCAVLAAERSRPRAKILPSLGTATIESSDSRHPSGGSAVRRWATSRPAPSPARIMSWCSSCVKYSAVRPTTSSCA